MKRVLSIKQHPEKPLYRKEIQWLLREKYGNAMAPEAEQEIKRILRGEPADYIIGNIPFLGRVIDLSFRPFIPRPETEFWTERAIKDLIHDKRPRPCIRCLDIFAGSGCIGVAVLKHVPRAHVDFAEKNERFLEQIRINIDHNNLNYRGPSSMTEDGPPRCRIIRSNIFSMVRGRYDYIFANPPYVGTGERVQKSVREHEPRDSVFAGKDGLRVIRPFLRAAKKHLAPGGVLYMEFGPRQKKYIEQLLRKNHYGEFSFHKDQYDRYRYLAASAR